jgi:hypothetical protein
MVKVKTVSSYKLVCLTFAFIATEKTYRERINMVKGKKPANRGAVAYSPLFRSPAREWFVL